MDKTNFKFIRLDSPDKFKDYWFKTDKISDKALPQMFLSLFPIPFLKTLITEGDNHT